MTKKETLMMKFKNELLAAAAALTVFSGCTEASQVNHNLRMQADNFNVRRKITVFNLRTDTVLFQMEGLFSISDDSDGDLDINEKRLCPQELRLACEFWPSAGGIIFDRKEDAEKAIASLSAEEHEALVESFLMA